ncbi:lysylphosphatidylglycerol synthase domain-containing protein [Nocardioides jishulii]|uniref:lysylphosphatidylglycerol synthase domain-containing protein n=1 Tax=Nocardioides jishulii TaxID=2575440 RepID=UPI001484DF1D|nr:lysylphosphatidylglycerol synthase domain-containing protein [Nocardioides jishulii]
MKEPRRLLGHLARVLFLVAVVAGAWWSLREEGDEVAAALATTTVGSLALSLVLVLVGLGVTGALWGRIFRLHGARVPARDVAAIFFVGQLGKYVPGSVWSIGVQARMAHGHAVGARATVSTSLIFLWVHLATGSLAAGLALPWVPGADELPGGRWVASGACVLTGLAALLPTVVHGVTRWLARSEDAAWGVVDTWSAVALMTPVWTAYALAMVLLAPEGGLRWSVESYAALMAAFALGYVAGVAVPVAPAGLGAREGVVVLLLAPTLGLAPAAAVAVLARVVHTVADFLIALLAWLARPTRTSATVHQGRD